MKRYLVEQFPEFSMEPREFDSLIAAKLVAIFLSFYYLADGSTVRVVDMQTDKIWSY